MAIHAELHRHLGGAVVPRIFWRYLVRHQHPLAARFPTYESMERFFTRTRPTLSKYLELHTLVEKVQQLETLPYFVSKLVRGAYVFESITYLELRYTPFYRTDPGLEGADRIAQMPEVVRAVAAAASTKEYPILVPQILCLHSQLPEAINRAMIDLAAAMPGEVCGIDLAGPDTYYAGRMDEFVALFQYARSLGLKTTAHLYETPNACYPQLLPHLDRIGHGLQLALRFPELLPEVAARGQCLELCPTTYLKTGTLADLSQLRVLFERCRAAGVDVVINTDNAGLHNVRLPWEYENLLTHDIIDFRQLLASQDAAFRHAFAWPHPDPPRVMLGRGVRK